MRVNFVYIHFSDFSSDLITSNARIQFDDKAEIEMKGCLDVETIMAIEREVKRKIPQYLANKAKEGLLSCDENVIDSKEI